MLQISIDGPKEDDEEGIICTINVRREFEGGIPWERSYMVKTDNYKEALKSAMGIIEKEELDK